MVKIKQEWWMPLKAVWPEGHGREYNWNCDHLGDAFDTMEAMWKEICRLRKELPIKGFDDNENI